MRKPDFFIVGAPKCGTTAMHQYLRQHPDIFMAARKEAHFFGSDLQSPNFIRDRAAYLSLFADATGEKRIGEASVWYLYSQRAAQEIYDFNPDASIVIMLRNPVEMIYSLHSQRYIPVTRTLTILQRRWRLKLTASWAFVFHDAPRQSKGCSTARLQNTHSDREILSLL